MLKVHEIRQSIKKGRKPHVCQEDGCAGRTPEGDHSLAPVLSALTDVLQASGTEVETFALRDIKLAHCLGCFGCWLETPGVCREPDAGRSIAEAIACSDTVLLITPLSFGGYSSEIKVMIDRFLPLILPFFGIYHGETHHSARYDHYPRWIGIGIQSHPDDRQAHIFTTLIGRNALNFHAPSYAAEVVSCTEDLETLRQRFQVLMTRVDPLPLGDAVAALVPAPDPPRDGGDRAGRALLIVGSPKTKAPSTSGALGSYLLEQLRAHGWETESLTLRAKVRREAGAAELLAAVDRADLILLAYPLYIDSLPVLVTKAMEVIAAHRQATPEARHQRLVVLSNCGFPEAYHNAVAIAMCHQFAVENGLTWAGSLAMGAGEALVGGRSLTDADQPGSLPVAHIRRALELTAEALAGGKPVPAEAVTLLAGNPLPGVPFEGWRAGFIDGAGEAWIRRAAANGVSSKKMLDRPYAG
jgi:multimeric flavodoxin WrbA